MGFKSSLSSIKQISFFSFVLGILTPGYLFGQSVAQEINPKLKILGTAEDYSGVRGVLLADIYGVADFDQAKTYSYQWLANGNAIAGATNQTIDVGDFKSSIENKVISVEFTYTNTSGQQKSIISAVMPYEGFRIVANAENGRNEWSGTTASEEIVGSVNPYPFVESYSNNGTSSTDGTSSGSAHNITAVKASDVGITAREGDNVIRIYADGSKSNRSELAHLNNETTFKEGEEYYFSGSFFAPKSEWDPVTEGGSTVITQLKQYGGGDPNFELRLSNNGDYKMFWRAVPHDLDAYQRMGSAIPDAWNDLKIYTKHSQGSDGVFRVWLNNEKAVDYSGATMYRSAEGYLKFGMYTEIHDERIIYWDAIDIADHLENDFDTWLSSSDNLPSLTVSGISDNQQFTSADQLSISGSAIDPAGNQLGSSGRIKSVDLFLDNTKIQSSTDSNFSFSNLNLSNGEHKLRLVATDTDGNTAEKNYTIWIGNKPADISIEASDFLLGSFNTDSDVALTTTATDSDGTITSVEFLANGQLIGAANKDNDHQYSLNWRPSQAGAYSIQARATDNQGAVTLSDSKAALVGTSITGSTLTATQDVTITQNSSSTGNYSNTEVYGSTSAPKIALVEFDLSDISSAKYIQSAVFKPYVTKLQNSPGTFSIYAAGTVDWNQTSADWYDKPSKGKLLDTITISSTNQYVSFDVTEALQDAIDAGQAKITLWIEDSEQEQQRFDFASENNSSISKPAELIVSSAKEALPVPVAGSFKLDGDSGDSTAPSFISAATSADGTKVILTYNEALSSTTAATSDFIITVDGSAATLSSVATSGSTVELTLSSAVKNGQTVTVTYNDPTTNNDNNAVQDSAGNDALSLTSNAVNNDSTVVDNQTTKLFVTQDVSIIENSSTNGDWSKNEVYGGSTPVIALVEFDLSSFSKGNTIQSATFRPYVRTLKNNQNSSFSIFSTTAKDWSQSSVQWRTRPLKDKRLDTITIAKSGSYVDFDVTNAIQAAIDNGQSKVTLWIEDSEKEYEGFEFDSVNDNPKYPNKPELVILTGRLVEPSNIPALVSINSSQYLIGSYKIGESITLKAAASDSDGSISKLEFLADGNLLGTATENSSGQYSFTWDASIGGAYSIQAKATDNQGAITLSDSKAVIITNDAFGNITITASQDVSIKDGMTGNWGDNEVYGHATNPFITLVEFNLDSIDNIDNLISATFEPYVVYLKNGAGDFSAYSTEYKSWNEKTVNWITKPDKGDLLDKITITELNKRASFEVTTAIENAVVSGHRSITLWIEDSEKEWEKFEFDSTRSDQPNPPQLILEFISMDIPDPIKGSTILPDNAAPSIQLVTDKTFLKAHETANITFTLSEPSSDFNEADINVYGGTLSNFSGSGKLYKVVFVPAVDSAINGKLSIKDGSFSNEAGIFNENQSDSDNLIIFHIDTSHPTMTLKGESKVTLEAGSEYSDQGAAATDVGDGDLSEAIKVSGEVDSNKPGTYELKYDVKDSAGNEAVTITRTVVVVDTASPVITLIGEATVRVEVGGAYEELGVTAKDSVDGNLTSKVKVTGKVDVKKVGEYQLKYTVSDAAGNAAVEKIRTVLVGDTERPIISLKGNPEITIEAGDVYNDAGAVATDVGDGDLSEAIKVSGEVDSNKPGTYELKYDVKDSAGNEAVTFTRTVIVVDTTPPVITLVGESIVTVEVGSDYEDQGTVANDSVDGDLTSKVKVTGKVDVQKVGKYQLKYNVEDASGNAAKELVRNVLVGDTGRPIISLRGDSNTTIEAGSIYEDAGAQAIDTGDGDLSSKIEVVSTVNTDKIGEYTVTYTVSDSSGNEAVEVKRVVKVVDTTTPVITMLGSAAKTVEAKSVYIDEGATAVDTHDEALVVTSVSTVNTDVVGSYTVIYNVSDASGNAAVPVIRKVIVVDTTSPVITLVGEAIVRVEVGNDYKDQGATAKDSVDGDLTSQIKVTGKVDVKKAGEYQLKYNVYDAAGNKSVELTRMVIVETAIIKTIHIEKYNSVPFWFKFKSKKEKSYAIESSTDLREWKQINVIKGTGAIVRFEDDRDQVFLQIFFRVRMID